MSHADRYVVPFLLTSTLLLNSAPAVATETEEPYTFVSMPDFLNADIGDLRRLPSWERGGPNSTNRSYRRSIDIVLDEVQAEEPDSVLVAGDLVMGEWGKDSQRTGYFGRIETFRQKRRALYSAGNFYYSAWKKRFASRDLTVFAAVGDHEIGDNDWHPHSFRYRAFDDFKSVWSSHFHGGHAERPYGTEWEDTAYATYLTPDLLLVTVDVFTRTDRGVIATVRGGQIHWLDNLLATTTASNVIVQGHTPVLGPVRRIASSGIMLRDGAESLLWQTLRRHEVEIYLAGEFHDFTAIDDGVLQIVHGSLLARSRHGYNYLVGRVYADRIELEVKRITQTGMNDRRHLWQTSWHRPPIGVWYAQGARLTGTATISDETTILDGEFEPWPGIEGE